MGNRPDPEVEPGDVSVEEGVVLLDGLGGVVVAMTPDAAAETARRLLEAVRTIDESRSR